MKSQAQEVERRAVGESSAQMQKPRHPEHRTSVSTSPSQPSMKVVARWTLKPQAQEEERQPVGESLA
jgi:hypothetical protein